MKPIIKQLLLIISSLFNLSLICADRSAGGQKPDPSLHAEQELKAAEAILYTMHPVHTNVFSGPGLQAQLQKLVSDYALDSAKQELPDFSKKDGQDWKLLKTIEGLKGP